MSRSPVRKLILAALPCLVLGLADPAFAHGGGGGHSGGGGGHSGGGGGGHAAEGAAQRDNGGRTGTATVGDAGRVGTVRADGRRFTGAAQGVGGTVPVRTGRNAQDQLRNRERVDRCPLDAILASDCQPKN